MNEHAKFHEYTQESYQTGSTRPPKSYGGIIAFLLILVIFLGGIVSILSMMNIRLFRMVETQDSQDISLLVRCAPTQQELAVATYGDPRAFLGITGQAITDFYQNYYGIPQGIYITQIETSSPCYAQGLRSGDILTHCNGEVLTGPENLQEQLQNMDLDDPVHLTFYRAGAQYQLTIALTDEE